MGHNGLSSRSGLGDSKNESNKERILTLSNIGFEFDSARLTRESQLLFDQLTRTIGEFPEISRIEIEGHTDNIGRAAYNLKLSQQRAERLKVLLDEFLNKTKELQGTPTRASGFGEKSTSGPEYKLSRSGCQPSSGYHCASPLTMTKFLLVKSALTF